MQPKLKVTVNFIKQAIHAFYAMTIAFFGALAAVMEGNLGFDDITDGQWLTAAVAALAAFGGVYGLAGPKPLQ